MKIAPNGDIFVVETQSGRVKVMRPSADGSKPQAITVFAQGLLQPFGIAFYPAANPQWVYVAETNRVVRYAYKTGDTAASAVPEVVVPQLSPVGGGHYTRDLVFSPDESRMFVSVGSQSNVPESTDVMAKKTVAEAQAWEAEHGLGATWGNEENRAGVMVFDVANGAVDAGSGKMYANGIRNCVGLTMQQSTGELWCTTNERDMLGDDTPDCELNKATALGQHFGYPYWHAGTIKDPEVGSEGKEASFYTAPEAKLGAHTAPLGLRFYTGDQFPASYKNQLFIAKHGSWNRSTKSGYEVVLARMDSTGTVTNQEIFVTGWLDTESQEAWGRPVDVQELKDGSLLISDDVANCIYRLSYTQKQ